MTDIEQTARKAADFAGWKEYMAWDAGGRASHNDCLSAAIEAAINAYRDSLAVPDEVEKRPAKISANSLAEAIAEMATNDRSALIQRIQEIIIEDRQRMSERANATIRHQAARIAELEAKYARLEKAGISAVVQCGRSQGQAESRADALAAQVEAMRGALRATDRALEAQDYRRDGPIRGTILAALAALKEKEPSDADI